MKKWFRWSHSNWEPVIKNTSIDTFTRWIGTRTKGLEKWSIMLTVLMSLEIWKFQARTQTRSTRHQLSWLPDAIQEGKNVRPKSNSTTSSIISWSLLSITRSSTTLTNTVLKQSVITCARRYILLLKKATLVHPMRYQSNRLNLKKIYSALASAFRNVKKCIMLWNLNRQIRQ